MTKQFQFVSILFITLILSSCGLADLSKDHPVSEPNEVKAKRLIQEMGSAHGIENWNAISTYQIKFDDEFFGFFGKQGNPFKEAKVSLALNYVPKTFDGQLEILTGKEKGDLWGISDWKTYMKDKNDSIQFKKDKDSKFWVPTYQYFIEFPNRIQEATAFKYLGQKSTDNIECEVVLASWGTIEAQKDLDQYLIWMDASTKRIVKIQYTIRDVMKFVSGTTHFKNYKIFDGILLPSKMPVTSSLVKKGLLHKMEVLSFNANVLKKEELQPKEK